MSRVHVTCLVHSDFFALDATSVGCSGKMFEMRTDVSFLDAGLPREFLNRVQWELHLAQRCRSSHLV